MVTTAKVKAGEWESVPGNPVRLLPRYKGPYVDRDPPGWPPAPGDRVMLAVETETEEYPRDYWRVEVLRAEPGGLYVGRVVCEVWPPLFPSGVVVTGKEIRLAARHVFDTPPGVYVS